MSDKQHNIICFAGAKYDIPYWTNRQEIMSRVSKTHRVLYVEPRLFILSILKDILKNPAKFFKGVKKTENLFIISQINRLPFSRQSRLCNFINQKINEFFVKRAAHKFGFENPVLWIYDTEACYYLGKMNEKFVLYDCVDKHEAQEGIKAHAEKVKQEEKIILEKANAVAVTSRALFEEKKKQNPNTFFIRNVGDFERFNPEALKNLEIPEDIKKIKRPIAGFVGAIDSYKLNISLLRQISILNGDVSFVLIGKPFIDKNSKEIEELKKRRNVYFLGPRDRKEIPAYVQAFDVCLIPYQKNEYNKYSFPLKFFDYMATGKPIIASGLPELEEFCEVIDIIKTPEEFTEILRKVILKGDSERREKRLEIASQNTWEIRTKKLLNILENNIK